jgi:transcriptional regulator with XRE-family HTH domain
MWQRYFSKLMVEAFESAKENDARLTLRGYARRLQMSPGVLSEIFREQRKISAKRAVEIALAAGLPEKSLQRLEKRIRAAEPQSARSILPGDAIEMVLNPLYYRLLCALEILPSPAPIARVARFLEVSTREVSRVAGKLRALDVVRVAGGQLYWQGRHVTTSEDIPSQKIQQYHRGALKRAVSDLAINPAEREYTSVTFAGCAQSLGEAKQSVRDFRDSLAESMRDGKPDRIYELTVQLRPVSKPFRES